MNKRVWIISQVMGTETEEERDRMKEKKQEWREGKSEAEKQK